MLHAIKRWLSPGGSTRWNGARDWAQARQHAFKPTREGHGFVIEAGAPDRGGWRLEWGPSQRPYIQGNELRLRGETPAVELQMLVLSRHLLDAMERTVFEQYTEGLQTRIDTATPEEMRWLVLFPRLPDAQLKILRDSFGATASAPAYLLRWLEGPLTQRLQQARSGWLQPQDPMALVFQRGRLALRLSAAEPDASRLDDAVALFEVALREARRVAQGFAEEGGAAAPEGWDASSGHPPSTR